MSSIKKIDNNGIEILLHNLSHSDLVFEFSSSQLVDSSMALNNNCPILQ